MNLSDWDYDPVPRYFFFLGDIQMGEVVFDGFRRDVCNGFNPHGEVWRALTEDDGMIGRYSNLNEAQAAVRNKVLNRGLKLVVSNEIEMHE